ncbi:MAG TPA: AmmeMemoRadiSam system protein B [Sedimentisphaerales bacterium]|nr:AmmeMemoRadiSam system protein B [Sedimentisphaerales bacterium]
MQKRKPIVAGQFYPGQHNSCIDEINECLDARTLSEPLPETIVAGIVPHAGWTFSGSLAAMVFSAVKQQHEKVHTFVIFGAAHGYFGQSPAVYDRGSWITPLGEVAIDEELADAVLSTGSAVSDTSAHRAEHSIEVQVPFMQYLFPGAKILPIIVPPREQAVALGTSVGNIINKDVHKKIVCIGSTDLTHYGPRYGFTPMGVSADALKWADSVNDQKFIDLALQLEPERLLASAAENCNACGPGAAAAAITAAKQVGKTEGLLLAHANSNEVMLRKMGTTSADSVGYAAIVF